MSQEEYIVQLENKVKALEDQVTNLTDMILLLNKKQFGRSSEKTPRDKVLENQLILEASIFNEAYVFHDPKIIEPPMEEILVTTKTRRKITRERILSTRPIQEGVFNRI